MVRNDKEQMAQIYQIEYVVWSGVKQDGVVELWAHFVFPLLVGKDFVSWFKEAEFTIWSVEKVSIAGLGVQISNAPNDPLTKLHPPSKEQ